MIIPVFLESPYAGDMEKNVAYAQEAMKDSILRLEAPFLSHLLYTQVLDDTDAGDRAHGLRLAEVYRCLTEKVVVYTDLGISNGMLAGIAHATQLGLPVEYRRLYNG
jgi:hypothetical protein